MEEYIDPDQLQAHADFLEAVGEAEPTRSCDMIRAWMKLNIESSQVKVWNN